MVIVVGAPVLVSYWGGVGKWVCRGGHWVAREEEHWTWVGQCHTCTVLNRNLVGLELVKISIKIN
jgi:hypothetical protein